jgi:hypothetical protein
MSLSVEDEEKDDDEGILLTTEGEEMLLPVNGTEDEGTPEEE